LLAIDNHDDGKDKNDEEEELDTAEEPDTRDTKHKLLPKPVRFENIPREHVELGG